MSVVDRSVDNVQLVSMSYAQFLNAVLTLEAVTVGDALLALFEVVLGAGAAGRVFALWLGGKTHSRKSRDRPR